MDISNVNALCDEKLENLSTIVERYFHIHKDFPRLKNRQPLLLRKLFLEFDRFLDRIEDIYFKHVLQNKCPQRLQNEVDHEIYMNRKMMDTVFPYVIMNSLLQDTQPYVEEV